MLSVSAKFSGVQAIEMVMLKELSPQKQSEILMDALMRAAALIERKMLVLAPEKTGTLKAAISIIPHKTKPGRANVSVEVGEGGWFKGEGYYAGFQEWGWHLGKRTDRGKGSKARDKRPFFIPPHAGYAEKALSQTADAVNRVAEDIIVERVREILE